MIHAFNSNFGFHYITLYRLVKALAQEFENQLLLMARV